MTARFFQAIEAAVHPKRGDLDDLDGQDLLAIMIARVAHDASQSVDAVPCRDGFVRDDESVKTLRFILRTMEATKTEKKR